MYAFISAIFAAICWGIAPAFGKVGLRGIYPIDGLAARTVLTVIFVGMLFIFNGGLYRVNSIPTVNWIYLSIEAFFATFAGDLAYYAALKWGSIGKTALVLAASPFITIVIGRLFFGETVTPIQGIGAALIVIGLILIGNTI